MNIIINQSLHGYSNGHELLAASLDFSMHIKRTILFQSDLSGSSFISDFETYLTGYPISENGTYVLSKTWFAEEMKRPGCVWTHSLIIDFSDLGKIPDLHQLIRLFKRPTSDQYGVYSNPIKFELDKTMLLANSVLNESDLIKRDLIINELYRNNNTTIIIPSLNSQDYEKVVLKIWSDQWPRLRRNFLFCTGAIGLKTLDQREYDLQVVPFRNLESIKRKSTSGVVILEYSEHNIFEKGIDLSINSFREFIWRYGSDIEGSRINYHFLVSLYQILQDDQFGLNDILEKIRVRFPQKQDAKLLKRNLFGKNSGIRDISEKELVIKLIINHFDFIDYKDIDIGGRLKALLNCKELSLTELLTIINGNTELIDDNFFYDLSLNESELIDVLKADINCIGLVLSINNNIFYQSFFWEQGVDIQRRVLDYFTVNNNTIDWLRLIKAIITSKSEIVFTLDKEKKAIAILETLSLINNQGEKYVNQRWVQNVFQKEILIFEWFYENQLKLSYDVVKCLFKYTNKVDILKLNLSLDSWKIIVKNIESIENVNQRIDALMLVFAISINKKGLPGNLLLEIVYCKLYNLIRNNNLNRNQIAGLANGYDEIEVKEFSYFMVWSYSKKVKKKLKTSNPLVLIRHVLIMAYYKNNWPLQSLLNTLNETDIFFEVFNQAKTFEVGIKILNTLGELYNRKKILPLDFQISILRKLSSNK